MPCAGVLLSFELNMYIPMSKNDENMERAHQRGAATDGKFWFRSHLVDPVDTDCPSYNVEGAHSCCETHSNEDHTQEMTCLEILMGKGNYFPGLVPLITAYMHQVCVLATALYGVPPLYI